MSAVTRARRAYIVAAVKARTLKSRLILHRKRGERAKRLRKAYIRASRYAAKLKRDYRVTKKLMARPLRERALAEARSMLGVVERGGNNTGPEVDKIIKANGGVVGEPWCGDGVAYWYRRAGSKAVTRGWAAAWGIFGLFGIRKVSDPLPGDLAVYNWQHVGVFEKWTSKSKGNFDAIEANTGTGGKTSDTTRDGIHRRHRNRADVKYFLRVTR